MRLRVSPLFFSVAVALSGCADDPLSTTAACAEPDAAVLDDGGEAPQDGAAGDGAADAPTYQTLVVLHPVLMHGYGLVRTCFDAGVRRVRLLVFRDGTLVLDREQDCADPIWVEGLAPGEYELSVVGFAGGIPWYAVGAGRLAAAYPEADACTTGAPVCVPLRFTVEEDPLPVPVLPLDLYCWTGLGQVYDECGF